MKLHIANRKLARFGRPILYIVIASMLLPLLFSTTAPPVAADPGWWDNNWTCRRSIIISGNHPEDCQIRIVIPYDSDMQVDYDDLRFLENETASELSYWIESYTANSATVWVRRLENTDSTIYVYYGNPSAASASNATNTFIFFDDFNDGSLGSSWTLSKIGGATGSYTESGTVIRLTGTDTGDMWDDADKILFLSISGNYDNVLAESYTPAWGGSHGGWSKMGGVQLRQSLAANSKNRIMSPVYSSAGATNSYRLTTGASTTEATTDTRPKYNRVSRVGGTSRAWYSTDGITWTELGSEISFTGGLADPVHLGTHLAGLSTTEHWVEIDWFRVRKYVFPEPSANVGDEETIGPPPAAFDFSVSASPDNLSVQQTGSVSTTVSVTLTSGTAGTVSLTGSWIGTAPGGVTPSFTPPSGTPNFGSTLTFSTTAAASVGTFTYRVMGTGGGQTHSDDVTLNITELPFPVAPSLVSPSNGITIDSLTPTFDWDDVAGAVSYTLQVATDNSFLYLVFSTDSVNSTVTSPSTLSYGTYYYWRVRGTNAAGSGEWSSTWSFTAKRIAPKVTTFEIAAGATYTNSTSVQLTITAQNAVEMSFSSDGVVWGEWGPYRTSKSYTLEAPDGPKNIYIRVRDNIKDVSQTSVASITLDQTPPSTQKDLSDDLRAEGYKGSVVVTLTSIDTTSGVGSTRYRVDGGEWKTGTTFVISSEGKHTIEYYSTDAAGNEEEIKSLQVTVYTPTILPPILTQYWWAFLSIIAAAVVVASFRLKGPSPKKRLKMVLEGKKEVLRLKKEAAVKYYKNGSIARGTYDELMRKYDDRMAELEEKERALRARMKKKVKKKVKKRRGLKRK